MATLQLIWNNPKNNDGSLNDKKFYSEMRYDILSEDNGILNVDFLGVFDENGKKFEYDYDKLFEISKNKVKKFKVNGEIATGFSEDFSTEYGSFQIAK